MQDQNVAPFTKMNRLQPAGGVEPQRAATHRATHGSSAWSTPSRNPSMSQPQDGASERQERASRLLFLQASLHTSLSDEPEDARMTGGTRSLTRRVLGLNVIAEERKSALPIKTLSPARVA